MMKLNHIGLLAKDCEEAVKHINEILGELNWEYFDYFFPQETVFIGKQFHLKTAVANFGPMDFEILQPYDGEGSYLQWALEELGPGLHHIAYFFDTVDEMMEHVEKLEKNGYVKLHYTERLEGHPTIYVQAPDKSMIYELHV